MGNTTKPLFPVLGPTVRESRENVRDCGWEAGLVPTDDRQDYCYANSVTLSVTLSGDVWMEKFQ